MKAKLSFTIEILDGPDAGLQIKNDDRVVELFEPVVPGYIQPYTVQFSFTTPELIQRGMKPLEDGDTIYSEEPL